MIIIRARLVFVLPQLQFDPVRFDKIRPNQPVSPLAALYIIVVVDFLHMPNSRLVPPFSPSTAPLSSHNPISHFRLKVSSDRV